MLNRKCYIQVAARPRPLTSDCSSAPTKPLRGSGELALTWVAHYDPLGTPRDDHAFGSTIEALFSSPLRRLAGFHHPQTNAQMSNPILQALALCGDGSISFESASPSQNY